MAHVIRTDEDGSIYAELNGQKYASAEEVTAALVASVLSPDEALSMACDLKEAQVRVSVLAEIKDPCAAFVTKYDEWLVAKSPLLDYEDATVRYKDGKLSMTFEYEADLGNGSFSRRDGTWKKGAGGTATGTRAPSNSAVKTGRWSYGDHIMYVVANGKPYVFDETGEPIKSLKLHMRDVLGITPDAADPDRVYNFIGQKFASECTFEGDMDADELEQIKAPNDKVREIIEGLA